MSTPSSLTSTAPSEVSNNTNNNNKKNDIITLTEKIKLKKGSTPSFENYLRYI
jgi:hypothetical protein